MQETLETLNNYQKYGTVLKLLNSHRFSLSSWGQESFSTVLQHNLVQGRSALVLWQPHSNTLDLVQLWQSEAEAAGAVSALARTEPGPVFCTLSCIPCAPTALQLCTEPSKILCGLGWFWPGGETLSLCQPRPVKQTPGHSSPLSKNTQLTSARLFFPSF